MSQQESPGHEFRVTLKGITLPPDVAARIDRALHRAVLHQLSDLDLATGSAVQFVAPTDGNGGTQGMEIIAELRQGG
jgi:hypothetical protein